MERPEFTLNFTQVAHHPTCTKIDAEVYGYIYWFTKLRNVRCTASNETLARLVGTTPQTIQNSLTSLEGAGFIRRVYKNNNRNSTRLEILPLLTFGRVSPTDDSNYHLQMTQLSPTGDQSKSIEKEQILGAEAPAPIREVSDTPTKPRKRVDEPILEVFRLFAPKYPKIWEVNTAQRKAASVLRETKTLEQIETALKFYRENKTTQFCPDVSTPWKLANKWHDLFTFKEKHNL